ncbi:hypothetical protein H6F89_11465 [Cyanobacteria bacterium FACHB-63]|nr:hypothetical protein [Cyanobacteria bacterium FACHB-63]
MLTLETAPITSAISDERGSGRIAALTPTCSQCREYDRGLCKLRARAEWDNCYVKADRKPCSFASLLPF